MKIVRIPGELFGECVRHLLAVHGAAAGFGLDCAFAVGPVAEEWMVAHPMCDFVPEITGTE